MKHYTYRKPNPDLILPYLFWTFAISWGGWGVTYLLKQNGLGSGFFYNLLLFLGSFGPMLGAMTVLKVPIKALPHFFFSGKKGAWIYCVIYSIGLVLISVLASGGRVVGGVSALASIPLGFLITALVGGGNEEPGWRGFLQPALEKKFPFPLATVLLGLIWSLWHLPLWWIDRGETSFLVFTVFCLIVSFLFAGLYKRSQSILVCLIFHALINNVPASFQGMTEALAWGDLTQVNPWMLIGGTLILILYSVWL